MQVAGGQAQHATRRPTLPKGALQALQMLSPPQQRTIELAVLQGRSHTQVAEETGLPLGTVKSHVRRGLLRMRQLLDAPDDGES